MGFLRNLFGGFSKKKKTFEEELAEAHATEWYEEPYNVGKMLSGIFVRYDEELRADALKLWFMGYFNSLENVKALQASGLNVDVSVMATEMITFFERETKDCQDVVEKVVTGKRFLFNDAENPYVRFAKKLNHQFWGTAAGYISDLIYLGYINVDKDVWLYDEALFNVQDETDDGEKIFEKVSVVLQKKNLMTQEIVAKIQELLVP